MKKKYFTGLLPVLLLIALQISSCKKNEDNTPSLPDANLTLLVQEQIGPEGGTLSSDEISIVIPQGAFSQTEDIKLYSKELLTGHPMGEDALSGLFQLEGIPSDFSKPVTVKIKGKADGGNTYLAVGLPTYYSEDSALMAYSLAETKTDGEYLSAEITPYISSKKSSGDLQDAASDLILEMILNSGFRKFVTDDKLISIDYPSYVPISSIRTLAKYINAAHLSAASMSFQTHKGYSVWVGKEWPVKLKTLNTNLFTVDEWEWITQRPLMLAHLFPGYPRITPSLILYFDDELIYYYPDALMNPDMLKLEQSAYRAVFFGVGSIINTGGPNWYNKFFASDLAAWAQGLVTFNQGFKQPLYFDDYIGYSLNIYADRKIKFLQSGYAPQLKYVDEHFLPPWGYHLVVNIFDQKFIDKESHSLFIAIESLIQKKTYEWYPDFMEEYLSGNIYTFDYSKLTKYISNAYTIKDLPFSGENGERLFNPLETKLYRFNIGSANLSDNDYLRASVEHLIDYSGQVSKQDVKLMAFVYDNNSTTIQHIATSAGEITISNLKQYQNNESILIAVIYAPHIDKTNQIQLSFKIEGGTDLFDRIHIEYKIWIHGRYLENNPPSYEKHMRLIQMQADITSINGSSIIANWDDMSDGYGTKGDIELFFEDETFHVLNGFEVREYSDYSPSQYCSGQTHTEDYSLSASGLEIVGTSSKDYVTSFRKDGCDGITVNSYRQTYYDLFCHIYEMDSTECSTDDSYLDVSLIKLE